MRVTCKFSFPLLMLAMSMGAIIMTAISTPAVAAKLDIQTTLAAALVDYGARDFNHAITKLSDLSAETRDPDHLFQLALVQFKAGENEESAKTITKLLEISPRHADAYYLLGLVNLTLVEEVNIFRKLSVAKQALQAWQDVVRLNPNHLDARYAVCSYYAVAPGIAGGDMDRAREEQAALAALDEGYGELARGIVLSQSDEPEDAESAYRLAAKLLNRAGPHFALAQFYMRTEQYEKAILELELYQQQEHNWWDPDVTVIYLFLARANAKLGQVETARRFVQLGLDNKPNKRVTGLLNETLTEIKKGSRQAGLSNS